MNNIIYRKSSLQQSTYPSDIRFDHKALFLSNNLDLCGTIEKLTYHVIISYGMTW